MWTVKSDVRFAQERNTVDTLDDTDQRRYVLLRNRRQMAERPSPLLSQPERQRSVAPKDFVRARLTQLVEEVEARRVAVQRPQHML